MIPRGFMETEELHHARGPLVDFSFQLNLARDRSEKKIFAYLCEISEKNFKEGNRVGAMIVLGIFGSASSSCVDGMRKLTNDKMDVYINVNFSQFKDECLKIFDSGDDGAIIINQDGQIIGDKVYLTVDDPTLGIPEGTGTRHITAASFSTRKDVLAVFTLSEQTNMVRVWKNGEYTGQFHPDQKDE